MMWLAGVVLSEAVFNSVSALLVTVRVRVLLFNDDGFPAHVYPEPHEQ